MSVSVLVTGASGFIAQQIIKQLLAQNYNVVGSVRTAQKGETLSKNFASPNFSYAVVPDMSDPNGFDDVLSKNSFEVILHTASPVTFDYDLKEAEKKVIEPAVAGTINILESVQKHGKNVKNIVVTSSIASMFDPTDFSKTINEESWNPITSEQALSSTSAAYFASKTFAEKALWKFIDERKPSYSIATIHPVYVLGPQAIDSTAAGELNFTADLIKQVLDKKLPDINGSFVDVRDVAKAHLLAFQRDANRKRLILYTEPISTQKVLRTINKNFPGKVQKPDENYEEPVSAIDDSKTSEFLGFKHIDLETSLKDAVQQILDNQ